MAGGKHFARIDELRRRLAEEMAHEYPTGSSAIGLVNHMIELGDRLVMHPKLASEEDRYRYRAMYHRLKELAPERLNEVVFYDLDEEFVAE